MSADSVDVGGPHVSDEDLLQLIDGELPGADRTAVRAHLGRCAGCAARASRMQQLSTEMNSAWRAGARYARLARIGVALAATLYGLYWIGTANSGPRPTSLASVHMSDLPVAYLTPGARRAVTSADICRNNSREDPDVPASVRHAVLRNYGAASLPDRDFELDYLITPELGGATDAQNLWPERYASAVWNAHVKDELEQLLHRLVCSGSVPLESAQRDISRNWIAAYKRYFHTNRPGGWPAALPQPLPLRE